MNEYQDKKNKLIELRNRIIRMPDNIEKNRLLYGYYGLLCYLKDINVIKKYQLSEYAIDDEYTKKYDKVIYQRTVKGIDELASTSPLLITGFQKLIKEYKNHKFSEFDDGCLTDVDSNKMYGYLFEFFKEMGVKELYDKMALNGNITINQQLDCATSSVNAISVDNPCIVMTNPESHMIFYINLAHEMGHSYERLLRKRKNHFETFNMFTETTATFFERYFCEFLKTKNIDPAILSSIDTRNHIYNLNNFSAGKVLCRLLKNDVIYNIDPISLNFESYYTLEKIQEMIEKECGYFALDLDDLGLCVIFYSIGDVIANNLINKMKKDPVNAWKEYKEFIRTYDSHPLKESLDAYFDVDLMKENIKTFMKSYQSR